MLLKEEYRDLFTVNDYVLAQCISSDLGMGAGIAVEFNKRYDQKNKMQEIFKDTIKTEYTLNGSRAVYCAPYPGCFTADGKVLNLITKERYWQKPTYATFQKAVSCMADIVRKNGIKKIATYQLGCTRDKLSWNEVKKILETEFKDMDIEILICIQ